MTTEIKLIHNKNERYYKVTVNGKDHYKNFTYSDDIDEETDVRRTAKAAAFDECLNNGKIMISYISY